MPCIIFSVHLRQKAAHYLHSTQISGLVSAGISFRSEWICLLSKVRACHRHLLKGVTLKRACVHVVSPLRTVIYLNLWYMQKQKLQQKSDRNPGEDHLTSVNCRFYHFLPEQQPIKTEVSASFCRALLSSAEPLPGGEMCDASPQIWLQGSSLPLNLIFIPSLLSLSLSVVALNNEAIGDLLFQQIPKSPKAVTPPPQGYLDGLSEWEEDARLC